ncbi:hypothetical protein KP509_23G021300 [Ceratopteris richardii]|uniref:Uncharacterized protein n=1 Tax=Ceratopteris richardii TaxID=49495 RepID=A0A8T2S0U2_CERRI|nr:hypothetical protein KP509_23G021300 [Ceratopteris richardii]
MKIKKPPIAMLIPGRMKAQPHPYISIAEQTKDPRIFPTEVYAFQMPITRPLFLFPNQRATTVTTDGQPVAWKKPAIICR